MGWQPIETAPKDGSYVDAPGEHRRGSGVMVRHRSLRDEIAVETRAASIMKPKVMFKIVAPMTASLKGYTEPKMHLVDDSGKTLCGRDWAALGWGVVDEVRATPDQNGDFCAKCFAVLEARRSRGFVKKSRDGRDS